MKRKLLMVLMLAVTLALLVCTIATTALADEGEAIEPQLSIYKKNVQYADLLHVVYALDVSLPEGVDITDVKMLFWNEAQDSYDKDSESIAHVASYYGDMKVDGVDRPTFRSAGIAAREVVDDIYARAYVTVDGVDYYSEVMKYSVLEYVYERFYDLDNAEETADAATLAKRANQRNLYNRTLEYSAAAQTVLGTTADMLATAPRVYVEAIGGTLPSGFSTGVFPTGTELTVTATADDEWFKCWRNADGIGIAEDKSYTFTAKTSTILKAVEYSKGLEYERQNTYCVVSGIGTCTDKEILIPPTYDSLPVQSIKRFAFEYVTSFESIVLCDSIQTIGEYAFSTCTNLKDVSLPYGLQTIESSAFSNCENLWSIVIPNTVTGIGASAFRRCYGLEKVALSTNLKKISDSLFSECENLQSISIPDSVTSIGRHAFSWCERLDNAIIGNGTSSIGEAAFLGCSSLLTVTLGSSVASVGAQAFLNCYKLVEICNLSNLDISCGLTDCGYVGYYAKHVYNPEVGTSKLHYTGDGFAFYDDGSTCSLVSYSGHKTSILLPESYNGKEYSIGAYSFYNCESITDITIPNTITSIAFGAFCGCASLESIKLPYVFGEEHFGYIFGTSPYDGGVRIQYDSKSYYIPNTLTSVAVTSGTIPPHAFTNYTWLTDMRTENGVTSIGEYAFGNCEGLTNIVVPDSVTYIGFGAFSGCSMLESITVPFVGYFNNELNDGIQYPIGYIFGNSTFSYSHNAYQYYYNPNTSSINATTYKMPDALTSVTVTGGDIAVGAFSNCKNIKSVTIPDSAITIGDYAFYACYGLASSSIPYGVTNIGAYAYYGCSGLTEFTVPDSVIVIGNYAVTQCSELNTVIIGDGVEIIGDYAFYYSPNLTELSIGSGVEVIGQSAFHNCYKLTSLIIPDGVTNIGNSAFYMCKALKRVKIGDGVTVIGKDAFGHCTELYDVEFGSNVTTIGEYAFVSCSKITEITLPDSITSIGSAAFQECYIETATVPAIACGYVARYLKTVVVTSGESLQDYALAGATYLTDVTLPNSIRYIGKQAFSGCEALTEIVIPSGVVEIGEEVFLNCKNLVSITIPNSVTSIGYRAFSNCRSLTNITIPDSVTAIGATAFENCSSLKSVTFENPYGWKADTTSLDVSDPTTAATYLRSYYKSYAWTRT